MSRQKRSTAKFLVLSLAACVLPSCKDFQIKANRDAGGLVGAGPDAGSSASGGATGRDSLDAASNVGSGGTGGVVVAPVDAGGGIDVMSIMTTGTGGDSIAGSGGNGGSTGDVAPGCIQGATRLCKNDPDLDALGNCGGGMEVCAAGVWGACSVQPAAKDTCALTGDDANCNGRPNEGCPCVDGDNQACGPAADIGICRRGTQVCAGGAWGACVGAVYAAVRDCTSAADNNCDGMPDNTLDAVCVCAAASARPCDAHAGKDGQGRCKAGSQSCVVATDRKTSAWGTCTGSVAPAAKDTCVAGNDDNCNGVPNEGCTCVEGTKQPCGPAAEVGICKKGTQTCTAGAWGACVGAVSAAARDCTSALDNNCDGLPDNTVDAVCGCASGTTRACGQHAGKDGNGPCKAGSQSCVVAADKKSSVWGTCTGAVGPAAADTCDPTNDDNCNGIPHDSCTCTNGTTRSCGPAAIGICKPGTQACTNGSWGTACPTAMTALPRDCTSTKDNDCNGIPDNMDSSCTCPAGTTGPCPGNNTAPCKSGTRTCSLSADKTSTTWGTSCAGQILPAAADTCTKVGNDENCNSKPNEGCACTNDAPPKACPCGTQTCTNGKLNPCVISCPGACVGGACCAAPKTPQCSSTMCCNAPAAGSNLTISCAAGTSCQLQCTSGNHACSGTVSPCYANDNATKCGAACTNCAQPNQNPVCNPSTGACANTCKGTTITCPLSGHSLNCGSWDFESGIDGWIVDSGSVPGSASVGGLTFTTVHPASGTHSLTARFSGDGVNATSLRLTVPFCDAGSSFALASRTVSMQLFAVPDTGSPALTEAQTRGFIGFLRAGNLVGQQTDFSFGSGQVIKQATFANPVPVAADAFTALLTVEVPWSGTFYIDAVVMN